jgi:alkylated DNA repair dioxygenase AlkB
VKILRSWLSDYESSSLFALAKHRLPWAQREVSLFGRRVMQPRLVALVGQAYSYSGLVMEAQPIPPWAERFRSQVSIELGQNFNSILFNLYRDGLDSMGWHSDDERALGDKPVIASLSVGAARDFLIRPKGGRAVRHSLKHGDLLVMPSGFQETHQHCVPKMVSVRAPRINVTFRTVL